ncbi:hypothetical protein KCV01_g14908, partial [Aureobasidium melanogenum]
LALRRPFTQSALLAKSQDAARSYRDEVKQQPDREDEDAMDDQSFKPTEKAKSAAQLNLSAKLSKDGNGKKGGQNEIWRLLKIARPELKVLSWAFLFLLISSSISMSLPFSIGKILDAAT